MDLTVVSKSLRRRFGTPEASTRLGLPPHRPRPLEQARDRQRRRHRHQRPGAGLARRHLHVVRQRGARRRRGLVRQPVRLSRPARVQARARPRHGGAGDPGARARRCGSRPQRALGAPAHHRARRARRRRRPGRTRQPPDSACAAGGAEPSARGRTRGAHHVIRSAAPSIRPLRRAPATTGSRAGCRSRTSRGCEARRRSTPTSSPCSTSSPRSTRPPHATATTTAASRI